MIYTKLEEETQIIGHVVHVNFISHFVDLNYLRVMEWICSTRVDAWLKPGQHI